MKLAVIMTCFNRAEKTKNCIERLLLSASRSKKNVELQIFICNDGSTDSTEKILSQFGPVVTEIKGTGNLFWARGMAAALEEAEKYNHDFYLMVNDDVAFEEDVLDIMFENYDKYDSSDIVIVGATKDDRDETFTYGGYIWNGKARNKVIISVKPENMQLYCNTANWNCVLIPERVYHNVGKIDTHYEHSFADFDYSNRVIAHGYKMYVADKYVGYCRRNEEKGTWRDKSLSFSKRIKLLHRPNGFPPKSSWRYARKYYGIYAPVAFLTPYLSILKNSLFRR